ncbi:MAG: DNA alkylation repair protein [Prevotellaceae bacterium]|jgi:3-methyladenine DNA glycosylase AlkD|nr:DNA alkylation repair protein [Prevotellaceae bacterium]
MLLTDELKALANAEKAKFLQGFFKTGKGQYAEGDLFLGITVPQIRAVVKPYRGLSLSEIETLVKSEFHEIRLAGFLLLVERFKKSKSETERGEIYDFYLRNARRANNWDLVDLTCKDIVGAYLLDRKDRRILARLAQSDNLWEQRIAMVSTFAFIKNGDFGDALAIAEQLLPHRHDLIHKAVGWMLRETGKKDKETLLAFLDAHAAVMPRTALRYAIEHFSPDEREKYMSMKQFYLAKQKRKTEAQNNG